MAIRPTHTNPILQNQASIQNLHFFSGHLQAYFQTQHWINKKPLLFLKKKKKSETKRLKYSSQRRSAPWNAKHITLPLRILLSKTETEQRKPCFSLTWEDSPGSSSGFETVSTQINTAELWKPLTCAQTRVPCTATVYSSNKPSNQPPCWGGQNAFRQDTGKCFALSEVTCWGINSNNFKSSMKEERARRRVLLRLNGRDGSVLSLVGFISLLSLTLPHTETTAPSETHLT